MGRMKLLLDIIADMRSLADSLQAAADAMMQDGPAESPADSTGGEAQKEAMAAAPPYTTEEKPPTLEEVRAVLAEKSRAGHTAKVKELLNRHGADKLSEIDPAEYPALLAEAEVL